jgi:hypothetical protein
LGLHREFASVLQPYFVHDCGGCSRCRLDPILPSNQRLAASGFVRVVAST